MTPKYVKNLARIFCYKIEGHKNHQYLKKYVKWIFPGGIYEILDQNMNLFNSTNEQSDNMLNSKI